MLVNRINANCCVQYAKNKNYAKSEHQYLKGINNNFFRDTFCNQNSFKKSISFCAVSKKSDDDKRDISLLNGPVYEVGYLRQEGLFSIPDTIKIDKPQPIEYYLNDAIAEAYGNEVFRFVLRDMQYNNGTLSKKGIEYLSEKWKKEIEKDSNVAKKYPAKEDYINNVLDKIKTNLKEQEEETKQIKPLDKPGVLWKGVEPSYYEKICSSLKPSDKIVLDWCPICTTPYFDIAQMYTDNSFVRIKYPKGTRLARCGKVYDREEVRIPSKSLFKFLGKTEAGKFNIWDFELIQK